MLSRTQFCWRLGIFWFCATGKSGLGHLRRATSIAVEMRGLNPNTSIGLLTNAPPSGLPVSDLAAFSAVEICARPDMAAWLGQRQDISAVAIDTAILDGIETLDVPLAIILRETPRDRQARFALPGGREWDLMVVPNPPDHWLPDPVSAPARRCEAVGWVYRSLDHAVAVKNRPEVLVATGGGGTAETAAMVRAMLDPVLRQARDIANYSFDVAQALGPRAPAGARLAQIDRVFDPGGDLNRHFASADVVISTAGYNSVLELAALDVPTMLLAIPRNIDDQAGRARLWGPRLGFCLDAGGDEATEWLARAATSRRRRQPWDLGPSGAVDAARLLLGLAG